MNALKVDDPRVVKSQIQRIRRFVQVKFHASVKQYAYCL